MSAKGTDKRGQGGASATIVSTMRDDAGATHVDVLTDFHITGRLARFGRSGMIEDISKRLMRDFAECLQATIEAGGSGRARVRRRLARGSWRPSPRTLRTGRWRRRAAVRRTSRDAAGRGGRLGRRRGGGGRERERGAARRGEARRRPGRPGSRAARKPATARGPPGRPLGDRRGARAPGRAGADGVAERLAGRRRGGRGGGGRRSPGAGVARAEPPRRLSRRARPRPAAPPLTDPSLPPAARPAARSGAGRSGRDGGGARPDRVDPAPRPRRPADPAGGEARRRLLVVRLGPPRADQGLFSRKKT